MNRSFGLLLIGVIVVGLAVGAGLGAYQRSASASPTASVARASQSPSGATGGAGNGASAFAGAGAGASGMGGSGGFGAGAPITGTVASASPVTATIKTATGEQTVQLDDQTVYRQLKPATLADLKPNESVVVTGERAADGTVTARTIQVGQMSGQAGGGQRGAGQFGGQAGTGQAGGNQRRGGQSSDGQADGGQSGGQTDGGGQVRMRNAAGGGGMIVVGTVKEVGTDRLTLTGPTGETTVIVTTQTRIRRLEPASASDLKPGVPVAVTVRPGGAQPTALLIRIGEE